LEFKLSAKGDLPALENETCAADIELAGNANGLVADPIRVSSEGAEILHALGKLPLALVPEPGAVRVRLEDKKPFTFQVATACNARFWDFVGHHFGVRIADPEIEANLEGTLQHVRGTLRAQAAEIARSKSTNDVPLPAMARLRLAARLEQDNLRLSELTF